MKSYRLRHLFALLLVLGFSLASSGCYVSGRGHDDRRDDHHDDHDHHDDDHR